jgi:signal transduction histidine kinase
MWEKVVFNLLSNAFKFTFEGSITVALHPAGGRVELLVRDTGTGIAAEELPHIFERFHRVHGARGRTHEGTGIGLALVHELVKLHGGEVTVVSQLGEGTTFTVSIPIGAAHLPADRLRGGRTLASTALGATPYVEEALRWLPEEVLPEAVTVTPTSGAVTTQGARVLVADDNADMREYLGHLLSRYWTVETVGGRSPKTDDGTAQLREIIARQTAHLTRMVDDLLDLTRLETGRIVLQRRPLDLRTIAESALASLTQAGKAADHTISFAGRTLWVEGDPTRLEQVIFNLLDNAVKHTPPGEQITITMDSEGTSAVVGRGVGRPVSVRGLDKV